MAASEKTISSLVKSQLPDFIRSEHPKFQQFLELYYNWLEQNSANGISNVAGNTVYQAMQLENYRDIDQTPDEFLRYFKQEILPYFPENTSLSTEKILKAAREFYSKKGSDDATRWLFKVLFDEDIEISYPKEQILIASDGKWAKPKAFRITITDENKGVNPQLFKKRLVTGLDSGATCVIESADRNVDPTNGKEILEIYISNIRKYFNNGELIEIKYVDENGVNKTFRDRIIGTISNIRIDSNIKTDPEQRRRGLYYNVGDPVVVVGGLGYTLEANDAAAIVGNVTPGSIEAVTVTFPGFGYRTYYDTETIVLSSVGDYPGANDSTDLRVSVLNVTACTSNSQRNFLEPITYDRTIIDYLGDTEIGNSNLAAFSVNNHNAIINVTENDEDDAYNNYEQVWANGTNYVDARFTAKIATPNNAIFGVGGPSPNTGGLMVYDIQLKGGLTVAQALAGASIYTKNTSKSFVVNSVTTDYLTLNANSMMVQCFDFNTVNTGGLALISVLNGGYGFRSEPALKIDSHYDTQLSGQYDYVTDHTLKTSYWQTFKDLGQIAHVWINSGGDGYAVNDTITFSGRGYGGNAYVQSVNGTGAITSIVLTDRGEGHLVRPNVVVSSVSGANASLTAYLFGDGATERVYTSAIGRIKDIRLIYRGYDYIAAPNVFLKVMDAVINPIPDANVIYETEYVFQGTNLNDATFKANVKSLNRTANTLRMYNQSGVLNPALDLITANGVYMNLNTAANVTAPAQYPAIVRATGLPNPMIYGNGAAKAKALFANGLIEFNGFYLNTDGFVSADKVLQDDKKYHNFSYVIQSEKSLADFETPIKNIAHPAGLSLIAKTISKSEEERAIITTSNVDLIMPGNGTSGINIANSFGNTVIGFNTLFLPDVGDVNYSNTKVNVGDLFIVNDGTRQPISRIVSNVVSNTEIQVDGNFIYRGDGKLRGNTNYFQLRGNATIVAGQNTIVGFDTIFDQVLQTNDIISINNETRRIVTVTNATHAVANANFTNNNYIALDGTVDISGNLVSGTGTSFVSSLAPNNVIRVNSEFRTVRTVANDQAVIVYGTFTQPATGVPVTKYAPTTLKLANTRFAISQNTLSLPEITMVGDTLWMNIAAANIYSAQTGTVNIAVSSANVIGVGTAFNTYNLYDSIIINNQPRQVINISNATFMTVDSPFTSNSNNAIVYRKATVHKANVTAIASFFITVDNFIESNVTNLVYLVEPKLGGNATVSGTVNVSGNEVSTNTSNVNTPLSIVGAVYPGSTVTVNSEIRIVDSVTNGTHFVVNSAFNNAVTDGILRVNEVFSYNVVTLNAY